jgi:TRAP-type C4-dicarboxylate transport system substrate-binding protein
MQNYGPEKRLFEIDGLPFLVRSYGEAVKLWDIQRPYLASHMQKHGLRLLYAAPWPSQAFFFRREVNSLADIKGLRQRASNELTSRLAQLMGTVPTTVQVTDISQAMVTGTIHAFSTSATTAVNMKLWEVATAFYDANATIPKHMVFMNDQTFSKLSGNQQKAVLEASRVAEKRGFEMSEEWVETARRKLKEMGMKGGAPSPALMKELSAIGDTMRAEWLQKADDDSRTVMASFLKTVGRTSGSGNQ